MGDIIHWRLPLQILGGGRETGGHAPKVYASGYYRPIIHLNNRLRTTRGKLEPGSIRQPSYRNVLDLAEARDGGLHSSDNWNPETCAPSSSQTTITSPSLLEFFYTNRVEAKSSKLENVAIN